MMCAVDDPNASASDQLYTSEACSCLFFILVLSCFLFVFPLLYWTTWLSSYNDQVPTGYVLDAWAVLPDLVLLR